jgi:hypothetical protein
MAVSFGRLNTAVESRFGGSATYNGSTTVTGIFTTANQNINAGVVELGIIAQATFSSKDAGLSGAKRDDTLVIDGTTYTITHSDPDDGGVTVYYLEE